MKEFSRREVLVGGAGTALLVIAAGCGEEETSVPLVDAPPGGGDAAGTTDGPGQQLDATPQCEEGPTEDQIEGPFYRAGAPDKSVLVEDGDPGVRLSVSGKVLAVDCSVLAGALLDVWHADDAGAYDQTGYHFRGKLTAGGDGSYRFDTIIPGRYLNGAQYRPSHIHLKVSAPGFVLLTTQLYFEGDPFNDVDPFLHPSLIMPLTDDGAGGKLASFDFVLVPA